MKLTRIEKLFENKAIIRHGTFLLKRNDAIEFVNECEKCKVKILGVDGFFLNGDYIQPSIENSIDFTSNSYVEKNASNYDAARQLLKRIEEMYYEIAIEDD
ncbi:MAG TPA: hypothetical protein VFE32_21960 [Puia sp.]|jgi:hypothetical protein|nr:hypothetical protein [Puia sp.]